MAVLVPVSSRAWGRHTRKLLRAGLRAVGAGGNFSLLPPLPLDAVFLPRLKKFVEAASKVRVVTTTTTNNKKRPSDAASPSGSAQRSSQTRVGIYLGFSERDPLLNSTALSAWLLQLFRRAVPGVPVHMLVLPEAPRTGGGTGDCDRFVGAQRRDRVPCVRTFRVCLCVILVCVYVLFFMVAFSAFVVVEWVQCSGLKSAAVSPSLPASA